MTALLLNPTGTSQLLTYLTSPQHLMWTVLLSTFPGFFSLSWSFYFCPFSWYIVWLDLEPSSHMEHYLWAFLSMPVAFLGTPKPTVLA